MREHLNRATKRGEKDAFRRRYGMGVPDLVRATRSASDALTLLSQEVIEPFDDQGRTRQLHLHDLPWPAEVLSDLGDAKVELRVTLSYFVEPNPAARGWQRRYSYQSHGLRFDLRRATESTLDFRKRINDLARRGMLAVYPVTGWWKENKSPDRSDRGARYALIVSIETPGLDVDIWTPVAAEVGVSVDITT